MKNGKGSAAERGTAFLYFAALFFPVTEIFKQILLYTHYDPSYCVWYFPFQLCSMPAYLLPLYLKTKSPALESFLIDFSLLGGIFVFFDQSGMHYDLPVLTVHSYLWHIMMIMTGLYLMLRSCEPKTLKNYLPVAGFLFVFSGIAEILNLTLINTGPVNMFYISPLYHMDQVVFCDIAASTGDVAARIIYLASIITGGGLIHLLCGKIRSAMRTKRCVV